MCRRTVDGLTPAACACYPKRVCVCVEGVGGGWGALGPCCWPSACTPALPVFKGRGGNRGGRRPWSLQSGAEAQQPSGAFQGVGAMQRTPFVTGWVARGGGEEGGGGADGDVCVYVGEVEVMSNAMSHSALALWGGRLGVCVGMGGWGSGGREGILLHVV